MWKHDVQKTLTYFPVVACEAGYSTSLYLEVFHSRLYNIICYLLTQILALFRDGDHTLCRQSIVYDRRCLMHASQTRWLE